MLTDALGMIQVLKNIPDSFQIMGGNMIPDIGIWCDQTGPVLAADNFKRANKGIDIFSR